MGCSLRCACRRLGQWSCFKVTNGGLLGVEPEGGRGLPVADQPSMGGVVQPPPRYSQSRSARGPLRLVGVGHTTEGGESFSLLLYQSVFGGKPNGARCPTWRPLAKGGD